MKEKESHLHTHTKRIYKNKYREIYIYIYIYIYIPIYVCACVCVHVCVYACMYACMYVYIYITKIYQYYMFISKQNFKNLKLKLKIWVDVPERMLLTIKHMERKNLHENRQNEKAQKWRALGWRVFRLGFVNFVMEKKRHSGHSLLEIDCEFSGFAESEVLGEKGEKTKNKTKAACLKGHPYKK